MLLTLAAQVGLKGSLESEAPILSDYSLFFGVNSLISNYTKNLKEKLHTWIKGE
jgi:hypothetical protein